MAVSFEVIAEHFWDRKTKKNGIVFIKENENFLLPLFEQFHLIVVPFGLWSLSLSRLITVSKCFVKKVTSFDEGKCSISLQFVG